MAAGLIVFPFWLSLIGGLRATWGPRHSKWNSNKKSGSRKNKNKQMGPNERKMALMNLSAGQQWRCRHRKQTCGQQWGKEREG